MFACVRAKRGQSWSDGQTKDRRGERSEEERKRDVMREAWAGQRFGTLERWIRKPVVEWIRAVGEDMVVDTGRGRPLHEVDGFLKEVGRDDIGCKEVEGGGHVVGVEGEGGLLAGL